MRTDRVDLHTLAAGLYAGIVVGVLAGLGGYLGGATEGGTDSILNGIYVGVLTLATRTGLEPAVDKARRRNPQHSRDVE